MFLRFLLFSLRLKWSIVHDEECEKEMHQISPSSRHRGRSCNFPRSYENTNYRSIKYKFRIKLILSSSSSSFLQFCVTEHVVDFHFLFFFLTLISVSTFRKRCKKSARNLTIASLCFFSHTPSIVRTLNFHPLVLFLAHARTHTSERISVLELLISTVSS